MIRPPQEWTLQQEWALARRLERILNRPRAALRPWLGIHFGREVGATYLRLPSREVAVRRDLFVFVLAFSHLKIGPAYLRRVLLWGIAYEASLHTSCLPNSSVQIANHPTLDGKSGCSLHAGATDWGIISTWPNSGAKSST
jgi:hypothetical protein